MKFNTKCDHIVDIDQIKTTKIIKDEKLTLGVSYLQGFLMLL